MRSQSLNDCFQKNFPARTRKHALTALYLTPASLRNVIKGATSDTTNSRRQTQISLTKSFNWDSQTLFQILPNIIWSVGAKENRTFISVNTLS
jgi:hypothetical protein